MKEQVRTVVMSHLSDVQEMNGDTSDSTQKKINHRINFVKFLLGRYPNNCDTIDPDKEYEDFKKKHPNS